VSQSELTSGKQGDDKHLDEMTLLLYVERQLDRENAQEVSLHTQTCTRCLTLLRVLDRESRLLTRAMFEEDEPLPARLAEFQAQVKRSMRWIWGVVFGLAMLGIYALYTGYIEPWQMQLEQAGFGSTNLLNLLLFQGAFWKGWQSMFTLLEAVALMATMGVALFAFRRYVRRGSALAMVFASLGVMVSFASPATATEVRKGDTVEIKKDEVIKSDVFLSGEHVRILGTVEGDVYAFGQQVDISGHVDGDVFCFAQSARVSGQIDGSLRSFANNLTISGTIQHSLLAFNQVINLDSNGKIGRSITMFGETATLDGKVDRDVLAFFKQLSVSGTIAGNLQGKGESLSIGSGAVVGGTTKFEGDKEPSVASDAKLASPMQFKQAEHRHDARGSGYYIWRVIFTGAFVLLGLVLISLMPRFAVETAQAAENLGASFGLGVLVFPGVFIAAIVACITVVGLLVGISAFFLWVFVLISAEVVVGTVVGQWIMGKSSELWPLIARMAVGVIAVRIVTSLPWVGGWAALAVTLWGMGAVSLALYRRLQPVMAPNIPSVPMGPMGTPLPANTTVGGV
jgi:cytoskeletal protein CcmA (bactofilin family)